MFSLFNSSRKKSYLGIDIGTTSIKMVELEGRKGEKPTLKNYGALEGYGYLDRVNNAIQTSSLKMFDSEVKDLLSVLIKKTKPKATNVIASLPSFASFTTLLDIPMMSPAETAQAVNYQARAFVPMPLTEVTIDWLPITEYDDERGVHKQQIFLISVPNDHINKYKDIFSGVGLTLRTLEVEGLSLARLITTGDPTLTLVVDIGGRSSAIAVCGGGLIRYCVQTDFAGGSLTQSLASGLNINIQRAEELKKQRGLAGTGGEYELSTLIAPFLDVILSETKRVKDAYEKTYKGKIERIVLSGGGANLKGIEEYVSKEFGMPVLKVDPSARINYPPNVRPLVPEIASPFAVAFGLALREFI